MSTARASTARNLRFKTVAAARACAARPLNAAKKVVKSFAETPAVAAAPARRAAVRAAAAAAASNGLADRAPADVRVAVFGATGYIGRIVVKALIARGFNVVAVARQRSGIGGKKTAEDVIADFPGATVKFSDVTDAAALGKDVFDEPVDVVVSCLASRTGGIEDSWAIDYKATKNCLDAGRASGAAHFVLLSAICVQKPLLEFQRAKLKFESELQAATDITHSIVRPTAFFKSLAGQVDSVKKGGPYVMFGDGHLAACKPISEEDLAEFMADCIQQEDKVNQVLPIGGPGPALDPVQQADILFGLLGKEPKTFKVPVALMDGIIGLLDFLSKINPGLKDAAEFGRIGKYYATESMLVYDAKTGEYLADATPSYGKTDLETFFKTALKEGLAGQELGDQAVFGQK